MNSDSLHTSTVPIGSKEDEDDHVGWEMRSIRRWIDRVLGGDATAPEADCRRLVWLVLTRNRVNSGTGISESRDCIQNRNPSRVGTEGDVRSHPALEMKKRYNFK